jgi:hypothetical protein
MCNEDLMARNTVKQRSKERGRESERETGRQRERQRETEREGALQSQGRLDVDHRMLCDMNPLLKGCHKVSPES